MFRRELPAQTPPTPDRAALSSRTGTSPHGALSTTHRGAALFAAALLLAATGCEEQAPDAADIDLEPAELHTCIDQDGDGFGRGCDLGRDCDDADPDVTTDCWLANCETTPTAPGCACDAAGTVIDCGEMHSVIDDRALCGYGAQLCDDGQWSGCRLTGVKPTRTLTALVDPNDCPGNPCDPYCKEFITTPTYTSDTTAVECAPDPSCRDGVMNQGEQGVDCGGECVRDCSVNSMLLHETFNGTPIVVYKDDTFGATNAPDSASGVVEAGVGRIRLGQQVGSGSNSGAWMGRFTADAPVNVSFDWKIEMGEGFTATQCGEVNTQVDGRYYASAVDWVVQNCGEQTQSGTFSFTTIALTSGEHTLLVGGWLSGNSATNSTTELLVQNYSNYSNPVATGGDAGRGGDLGFETCSSTECSYYQGSTDAGDTITWLYDAPSDGSYAVKIRNAAVGPWTANLLLDGTTVRTLSANSTGGMETWSWLTSSSFTTTGGTHTLGLEYTSGQVNVNRLEVVEPAAGPQSVITVDNIRVTATNIDGCANAVCDGTENCTNCPSDCGDCPIGGYCGDAICEATETCGTCASDCGSCSVGCGNGTCDGAETCSSCSSDCGDCPGDCGNGVCDSGESCSTCDTDCGTCVCGDGECTGTEDCSTCATDCGACDFCGNGSCDTGETCTNCETDCGSCASPSPARVFFETECATAAVGAYATPVGTSPQYVESVSDTDTEPGTDQASYAATLAAGTYQAYFLVDTGGSASDDSWYWRVPGVASTWNLEDGHATAGWSWVVGGSTINIPSDGLYTLEVASREDGLKIDQVALVQNGETPPAGATPESAYNCAPATCGNGSCETGEDCSNCATDCGACVPLCGDGSCDGAETCATCGTDCGACPSPPQCGDGTCDAEENCSACAADCGACPVCGDGTCEAPEGCSNCATDCGACAVSRCGDSTCDPDEDCSLCALDCGVCPLPPACGDGTCDPDEDCITCATDCGVCPPPVCGDGTCAPGENCDTCAEDCSYCIPWCKPPPDLCGDGTCNTGNGEDCATCQTDCGGCGAPPSCGNGTCEADTGEDCITCESDCGACNIRECGDGTCEPVIGESCTTCTSDCGACAVSPTTVCGDTLCSIYENCDTCPEDCGECPFWGTGKPFNGGIITQGTLTVGQRVKVNGDITGSNISLELDSIVTGAVDVNGSVLVNERVQVGGTLSVDGTLNTVGSYSTGGTQYPTTVTIPSLPNVAVSPGTEYVSVPIGGEKTLAPGQYDTLDVSAIATINLSSGTYHFNRLNISPDAIVNLDVSAGPIDIRVDGDVTIEARVKYNIIGGDGTSFGLLSNGNVSFQPQSNFPSSIYAPHGSIYLQSESTISGGLAAANVYLSPDITVGVGNLNTGWEEVPPPGAPPVPVCGDVECTPETGESCDTCEGDCGVCEVVPTCGDASCDDAQGENCRSCGTDCGTCAANAACGDGVCEQDQAESCTACEQDCGVCDPIPGNEAVAVYTTTEYAEDFDISTECTFDQATTWAGFSWEAVTPSNSKIRMYFSSAATEAELDSAEEVLIVVAAASATSGGWQYGPPATSGAMTVGLQYVDSVLKKEELPRHHAFARMRYELIPSVDGAQTPELVSTSLQSSCEIVQ